MHIHLLIQYWGSKAMRFNLFRKRRAKSRIEGLNTNFTPTVVPASADAAAPSVDVPASADSAAPSSIDTSAGPCIDPAPVDIPAISEEKKLLEKKLLNVCRWLFFSLIIASSPIILGIFSLILHDVPVTVDNTLAHGELLLVSVAILGEVTGDLVFNQTVGLRFRVIVTGFNLFFLIITIFFFADIVRTIAVSQILQPFKNIKGVDKAYFVNQNVFAAYCFFIFLYTFIMGVSCKIKVVD